jgi:hypothetical protein
MLLKAQLRDTNVVHMNARCVASSWQAARLIKRPLGGWASKTN